MEENKRVGEQGQTLVININLTRGMVAVLMAGLLLVAFVGYLALGQKGASASPAVPKVAQASAAGASGTRKYYMTSDSHQGNLDVTSVCTTGYHMASMWEMVDPSNLEYAIDLVASGAGQTRADTGYGPPAYWVGWVRTGWDASTYNMAGEAYCNGWDSIESDEYGTGAGFPMDWAGGPDLGAWNLVTAGCHVYARVWCIED